MVHSQSGRGSTFTVRLPAEVHTTTAAAPAPVRPSVELPAPPPPAPPRPAAHTPPTVLVVEDDANQRDLVGRMLTKAGYAVRFATTVETGINQARRTPPDAIVLDLVLSDGNGWRLLDTMKASPSLAAIPVVVVSVLNDRSHSIAHGATDHLIKPVDSSHLRGALRSDAGGG